ncbi:MAG: hypothetical protein ACK6EB_28245, partial [Planctomyces sp.]
MAKKNMLIPTGRTVGEKELFGQTEGYRTTEAQLQKIVRECEQNLKDWQPFIPAVSVYGTLTQE